MLYSLLCRAFSRECKRHRKESCAQFCTDNIATLNIVFITVHAGPPPCREHKKKRNIAHNFAQINSQTAYHTVWQYCMLVWANNITQKPASHFPYNSWQH